MKLHRSFNPAAFVAALKARGMSTPAMARAAGISEHYGFMMRSGYVPGDDVRGRVASALGVDEDTLWPILSAGKVA